jgi:hypothetical protein
MIVNPTEKYTLTQLEKWFETAQELKETLYIDPCNPTDPPVLRTWCVINTHDDLAVLTQWLGGLPE